MHEAGYQGLVRQAFLNRPGLDTHQVLARKAYVDSLVLEGIVEVERLEVFGDERVLHPVEHRSARQVGEDERGLGRNALADDLHVGEAHVLRAAVLRVRAVHHEHVRAVAKLHGFLAEHRVARVGDRLVADLDAVTERVHAVLLHVVHREAGELEAARALLGARLAVDVDALVAAYANDVGVHAIAEVLQPLLAALRPDDVEVLGARRHVGVLQQQERQPDEVIAVEVSDEDHLDVFDRNYLNIGQT